MFWESRLSPSLKLETKRLINRAFPILFTFLASAWLAILFGELTIPGITGKFNPRLIKPLFSSVCHQEEAKLLSWEGGSSFVCSRCSGIYTGIWFASLLFLILRNRIRINMRILKGLFIISGGLILFDVLADDFGFYSYSHFFSFITGIIWGQLVQLIIFVSINNEMINE